MQTCIRSSRAMGRHIRQRQHASGAECTHAWLHYDGSGHAPLKSAPSRGSSGSRLLYGSLDSHESATRTASQSVQPFLRSSPVRLTHRQTDHATCTAGGSINAKPGGPINRIADWQRRRKLSACARLCVRSQSTGQVSNAWGPQLRRCTSPPACIRVDLCRRLIARHART